MGRQTGGQKGSRKGREERESVFVALDTVSVNTCLHQYASGLTAGYCIEHAKLYYIQ